MIKTVFFGFLCLWPEPVRGSQREENFQKTSLKARKKFSAFRPPSFLFFKLVSSTLWPFYCFYLMYASFRSVTTENGKILTPTQTGNFLLTQWTRNSTRGSVLSFAKAEFSTVRDKLRPVENSPVKMYRSHRCTLTVWKRKLRQPAFQQFNPQSRGRIFYPVQVKILTGAL